MTGIETFLKVEQAIEPHPLMLEGHTFAPDDIPVITDWGDVLPPLDFSEQQLREVKKISGGEVAIGQDEGCMAVAKAAVRRTLSYNEKTGCWQLPLRCEYDEKNRARYPSLTIPALEIENRLAHRLTLEYFRGVRLVVNEGMRRMVDHRCMNHACCNPYHLELITAGENTVRGRKARARTIAPDIFCPSSSSKMTYGDLLAHQSAGYTN